MRKTKIQWADDTENPTMGCDGCELRRGNAKNCYAGVLHDRHGGTNSGYAPTFKQVTQFPGRMMRTARRGDLRGTKRADKPWLDGSPRLIFTSDMGDALSRAVSFDYLKEEIVDVVLSSWGQRHEWLWPTKRPGRLAQFSTWLTNHDMIWPANLWAGTSVTSKKTTARIDRLLRVGDASTMRFLSVEPQLESIDFGPWVGKVDWIIQGGESGNGARCFDVAWARDLMRKCRAAGTPFFLKQLGALPTVAGQPMKLVNRHGGNWDEWPEDLRVRQVPTVATHLWRPSIGAKLVRGLGPEGKRRLPLLARGA